MRRLVSLVFCCLVVPGCGSSARVGVGARATPQPRTLTVEELTRLNSAIDNASPALIKMTDLPGRDQWSGLNLLPLFEYLTVEGQGLAIIVRHVQPVTKPLSYHFEVVACQTIADVLARDTCMDEKVTIPVVTDSDWARLSLEWCRCPILDYPDDGWIIIVRTQPAA
jgi:hypothetical protein